MFSFYQLKEKYTINSIILLECYSKQLSVTNSSLITKYIIEPIVILQYVNCYNTKVYEKFFFLLKSDVKNGMYNMVHIIISGITGYFDVPKTFELSAGQIVKIKRVGCKTG